MSLRKDYSSLRKDYSSLRKSRPSGVVPQNLLSKPVQTISIPTVNTINSGVSYITDPLDIGEKIRSTEVKTCFYTSISIGDSGLSDKPVFSISIRDINYNGTEIHSQGDLRLSLSMSQEYLFVTNNQVFLNKMAFPRLSIKYAYFSDDNKRALFILQNNYGYILTTYSYPDPSLGQFLSKNMSVWINSAPATVSLARIKERLEEEREKREQSYKSPKSSPDIEKHDINSSIKPENKKSIGDVLSKSSSPTSLSSGLPSISSSSYSGPPNLFQRKILSRQTRSFTKSNPERVTYDDNDEDAEDALEELDDNDGEPIIREAPAAFEPPLKYSMHNNKKFVISYNDFKTLYNNDWINDTLIDFFIAYDMDHAVDESKVKETDIYAFNSFFFTKIFSKTEESDTPSYYQNVRRWLSKIDLMSYNSVIIPINENLHWYCAVIKGLPSLLAYAKSSPLNHTQDPEEPKRKKAIVEINIIDSLRQPHSNITGPLKTVIADYCREKHDVEVPTDLIRFNYIRVPRQRNFNDCGIHVIYNLRKWLSEPEVCEIVWRKHSKSAMRSYFKSSERSDMRVKLIATLLDLHSKQELDHRSDKHEEQSEDDIEEISYLSSKPAAEETGGTESAENCKKEEKKEVEVETESSREDASESPKTETQNQVPEPEHTSRTLDPRVVGTENFAATTKPTSSFDDVMFVEHPQIRRLCKKIRPKAHTITFLNSMFSNHNKNFDDQKQHLILDLTKKYNDTSTLRQLRVLEASFKKLLQEPAAPMDEPFVIQESDESSGELNRSVGDLRISEDELASLRGSRVENTPEATRLFMKRAEESSPSKLLISHQEGKDASESLSDFEVLDDEVEILSEVPGSETRSQNRTRSQRPSDSRISIVSLDDDNSDEAKGKHNSPKTSKRRRLEESAQRKHRPF